MQKGFTLSEILITLGIIGVVAAMTLPTVINNSRNKALETALKKNYSVIEQALNMYQAQNGERLLPENSERGSVMSMLMNYMKSVQNCGMGSHDPESCIPNYGTGNENNSKVYKTFNGKTEMSLSSFDDGQFVINDGSLVLIENFNERVYISVDVNGFHKLPNRLGQDLFMFQLMKKTGYLLPMGAKGTDYYSDTDEYCSPTSTNNMNGAGCTYKALTDNKYFTKLR